MCMDRAGPEITEALVKFSLTDHIYSKYGLLAWIYIRWERTNPTIQMTTPMRERIRATKAKGRPKRKPRGLH